MLTPEQRVIRARIGAHALHARHDPKQTTSRARETFLARFLAEVDPDNNLPEAERLRRAEHARKAYFQGLALKSALARTASNTAGERARDKRKGKRKGASGNEAPDLSAEGGWER